MLFAPHKSAVRFASLSSLLALLLAPTPVLATLAYDFEFENMFVPLSKVSGTIEFAGTSLGTAYTGLAPSSLVITGADDHVFGGAANAYTLGDPIVGDTATWNTIYDLPPTWDIDASGVITFGVLNLSHFSSSGSHEFQLGAGGPDSMLSTAVIGGSTSLGGNTQGTAAFSLSGSASAIPEPSAFLTLGLVVVGMWIVSAYSRRGSADSANGESINESR